MSSCAEYAVHNGKRREVRVRRARIRPEAYRKLALCHVQFLRYVFDGYRFSEYLCLRKRRRRKLRILYISAYYFGESVGVRVAADVYIYRRRCYHRLIIAVERLCADLFYILRSAETRYRKRLALAHLLDAAKRRVAALVVHERQYPVL